MSTKIEFELAAKDASAADAWKRQQVLINGVVESIGKLEAKSTKAQGVQESWMSKGAGRIAGMAAGYVSLTGVIQGVVAANQQMAEAAEAASMKYDTLFRKINVQANTQGVLGEEGKQRVIQTAKANASDVTESAAIAQALASSGFNAQEATGSGLDAVLKAQAAMGQQGSGQGANIAESTAKYMNAMQIPMTGENMRREMMAMQQASKLGFAKFEDMGQLSGKVGGFAGRASSADVMAAFNVARKNSKSADEASTGLKIFGDRLMGAKGDPQRERELKKAKLNPEDVDFIGENMDTVMERLDGALKSMPETERAGWMQRVFGTEAAGVAGNLIENRGEMKSFRAVMGDEAAFNRDVQEMNTGEAAGRRRQQVESERLAEKKSKNFAGKLTGAQNVDAREDIDPYSTYVSSAAANFFSGFGYSPDQALAMSFGTKRANEALADDFAARQGFSDERTAQFTRDVVKANPVATAGGDTAAIEQLLTRIAQASEKAAGREPVKLVTPATPMRPAAAKASR